MKHIRIILCLTLFLTAASAAARVRYTVNDAWRFTKGSPYNAFQPAADDSAWEVVNIPHTWNAEDAADDVPGFYRGPAWYRKRIVLPADAASKQAYIDAVNSLCTAIGKGKNFYQIIIPTQVEFLRSTFPPEVTSSKGDGFYNQSQASFIKRVADESVVDIKNIDVTALFAEKYAAEEYIYFNTDKNYTALGAYYAYSEYCKAAGLTPVSLSELTECTVDRFLGSFYTSTDSETLRENPDSVIFYDLDAKFPSDVTIYNGTSIFNKQKMIYKEVSSVANGFNVFFGREAYRIEIAVKEPTSNKSILVIGDLAAAPFVPFLSANYKNITYINATQFNDKYYVSMGEFLKDKSYDDILVIDYTTSYKSPFFFASNIKAMMEN